MPPVTFPLTQPQPLSTPYILISTSTVTRSHFRNVEVPGSTISPSPLRAHISLWGHLWSGLGKRFGRGQDVQASCSPVFDSACLTTYCTHGFCSFCSAVCFLRSSTVPESGCLPIGLTAPPRQMRGALSLGRWHVGALEGPQFRACAKSAC